MELIEVSNTTRRVVYEITAEDAQGIIDWYQEVRDRPGEPAQVRKLMSPMWAIANRREYGGH